MPKPFDWTKLRPVRIKIDASGLRRLAAELKRRGRGHEATTRRLIRGAGDVVDREVEKNLSGRVLRIRSRALLGSWQSSVEGTTYTGFSDVGYGALWERGFVAAAWHFPVPGKRVRVKGRGWRTIQHPTKWGVPAGKIVKQGPGDWRMSTARGLEPIVWRRTRGGRRPPRKWAEPARKRGQRWLDAAIGRELKDLWETM